MNDDIKNRILNTYDTLRSKISNSDNATIFEMFAVLFGIILAYNKTFYSAFKAASIPSSKGISREAYGQSLQSKINNAPSLPYVPTLKEQLTYLLSYFSDKHIKEFSKFLRPKQLMIDEIQHASRYLDVAVPEDRDPIQQVRETLTEHIQQKTQPSSNASVASSDSSESSTSTVTSSYSVPCPTEVTCTQTPCETQQCGTQTFLKMPKGYFDSTQQTYGALITETATTWWRYKIINFFLSNGMTAEQACAIEGNAYVISHKYRYATCIFSCGFVIAYGLFGLTDTYPQFQKFCATNKINNVCGQSQLEFALACAQGKINGYDALKPYFHDKNTKYKLSELTLAWKNFFAPNKSMLDQQEKERLKNAQSALNLLKDSKNTISEPIPCKDNQTNCSSSTICSNGGGYYAPAGGFGPGREPIPSGFYSDSVLFAFISATEGKCFVKWVRSKGIPYTDPPSCPTCAVFGYDYPGGLHVLPDEIKPRLKKDPEKDYGVTWTNTGRETNKEESSGRTLLWGWNSTDLAPNNQYWNVLMPYYRDRMIWAWRQPAIQAFKNPGERLARMHNINWKGWHSSELLMTSSGWEKRLSDAKQACAGMPTFS